MMREFEMINISPMSCYLDIKIKQMDGGFFISQKGFVREILKRFKIEDCQFVSHTN